MNFFYNITVFLADLLLKVIAFFNPKIKLFVEGRKETFVKLREAFRKEDRVIWFHCASLGEFEQGRPIIEATKTQFTDHKILLTFFSPSGYEVRKDYAFADLIVYLPMDTKSEAKKFVDLAHPSLAVFIKYEFWPNMLNALQGSQTPVILVSGIFRPDQAFFKFYGGWMRSSLKSFDHFFVQNENSKVLLNQIDIKNVTVSGDTRFDRVFAIAQQDNHLDFIQRFVGDKYTLVAGSTWPRDEELLVSYINESLEPDDKFIIAPHNINEKAIQELKNSVKKETILFSEKDRSENAQVFIIDTIGILTKIYSYADLAYVGGGFGKSGIHNVLEPAVFGCPLVIGPNYQKFQEAADLVNEQACESVIDQST
ncbi:MAG: glycosyltransferase N-terminal domain-containing protein [Flavobacteriaceae bacterium]|nr:glycosyltransferase N-terminal domain-containing protein [Flavobacteriaceae bacterium]